MEEGEGVMGRASGFVSVCSVLACFAVLVVGWGCFRRFSICSSPT